MIMLSNARQVENPCTSLTIFKNMMTPTRSCNLDKKERCDDCEFRTRERGVRKFFCKQLMSKGKKQSHPDRDIDEIWNIRPSDSSS